jgi:cytosine permease
MTTMDRLRAWWTLDEKAEAASADNPLTPLSAAQRRDGGPMLALAFGWGFLITGLLTGGALGAGLPFWPDLIGYAILGNAINLAIGALAGYIGYRTGCNSALIFRGVYGAAGAYVPVVFLALLTIGWQGIVVGAFAQVWTQSPDTAIFYAVAIFAGLLYTFTTYFGIKGLERVGVPSMIILVAVGLYAAYINIDKAGGWTAFLELSRTTAAKAPLTGVDAVNLVVGSWIVGAIVMAEYTRFSRRGIVALAIAFIVLFVDQIFLQVVGALGAVVSGSADFTTYMRSLSGAAALFALVGMTLALWTTGDTNLYLPSVQTASLLRRPKRVMVVVCGLLGTILGLGIYTRFLDWIGWLATVCPPLIGPVLVDYYLFKRQDYSRQALGAVSTLNIAAIVSFVIGAGVAWLSNRPGGLIPGLTLAPSLVGLLVSAVAYAVLAPLTGRLRERATITESSHRGA